MKGVPELDLSKICWKEVSKEDTKNHLAKVKEMLGDPDATMKYAEQVGKGNVLWPLRYALSGLEKSPDPFTLLSILGQEESLRRVERAIEALNQ